MKNTKFVVKVNRGGNRALEYVLRIECLYRSNAYTWVTNNTQSTCHIPGLLA